MTYRYLVGAAVGTAIAVTLTGCGGSAGPKKAGSAAPAAGPQKAVSSASGGGQLTPTANELNRASQKARQVGTFRVATAITSVASGQSTKMTGDAEIRLRPALAEHWTFSHLMTEGGPMSGVQQIILGDTLYMKAPSALKGSSGKPWTRLSLSKLAATTGTDTSSLSQQADPSATVAMLTASPDVHKLGQQTVHGVATTHYRGTCSLKDGLTKLGVNQRAIVSHMYQQLGLNTMTFDVWVDGQQLPREVKLATPAGARMRMTTTTVYSGYGTPVSVSPPPASQVADGNSNNGAPVKAG